MADPMLESMLYAMQASNRSSGEPFQALDALVSSLPKCRDCREPRTHASDDGHGYCDAHAGKIGNGAKRELSYASALRSAIETLERYR